MERMNDIELAKSFASQNAPSFSDVIARIEEIAELKASRRRDLISGLNVVAKAIGLAPDACHAYPIFLRPRIAKVRPAALGISGKSWTNSISNARSALAVAGIAERKRGTYMPLSPAWQELWEKIRASRDDNIRLPLSRFPGFCSRLEIAPEEVTEETVTDFRRALELSEIRKDPEKVAWQAAHAWNRAVERIPGWPQRKLQKRLRHGGETSQGLREMMLGLSMLGRELGFDAAHLNSIRSYANALAVDKKGQRARRKGLTAKNRERLRRLRDPEKRLSLLLLPQNLLEKAARERHPVKAARLAEVALAIAILAVAPIRLKNLASLEIIRHFDRTSETKVYLVIPEVEVKNGRPLEFELPERVSAMLDAFLKTWHPASRPEIVLGSSLVATGRAMSTKLFWRAESPKQSAENSAWT